MVSSNPRALGNYDLWLEYDGRKVGLLLAKTAAGDIAWAPALAPSLQPQFRTAGYGYEQVPAEIDIPLSWENFTLGCGFDDDPNDSPSALARTYSYSRGIDASEGTRLYLSPERQDPTTALGSCTKFLYTSLGLYAITEDDIYEWSSGDWVVRDSGGTTNYTDIIEMDGVLYAGRGQSADYKYSTDGTTWTAFTDSDNNFDYWAIRGLSSGEAKLWGAKSTMALRTTTDGQNSGVAWSGADGFAHTSETLRALVEINDDLFAFTDVGIYRYTGFETEHVWRGGQVGVATNGHQPFVWVDKSIYVAYQNQLHQYNPLDGTMEPVFPTQAQFGHDEINGEITAITGDGKWLYVAIENAAGNTYILKGNPYRNGGLGEWHTLIYLGAVRCDTMAVIPAGSDAPSSTNPTLMIDYGGPSAYFILAKEGLRPEDDTAYRFDSNDGVLYTSWTGFGTRGFTKYLNSGRVVGGALTGTETIDLAYEVDETGTEVSIVTANTSGSSADSIATEVKFLRARAKLTFATSANTLSPIGHAAVLHATPNPPRKRIWSFVVLVGDDIQLRGGGRHPLGGRDIEAFIFGAASKRVTLYDRENNSFLVRVLDVHAARSGEDDLGVFARVAEIGPSG